MTPLRLYLGLWRLALFAPSLWERTEARFILLGCHALVAALFLAIVALSQ